MSPITSDLQESAASPKKELKNQGPAAPENFSIHSVTLFQFTNPNGRPRRMASQAFCEGIGKAASEAAFRYIELTAPSIAHSCAPCIVDGYSIAHSGANKRNGVICVWEISSGRIVGGMAHDIPYVTPEHRGHKLGREILLRAFEVGIKTISDGNFFSPEGLATRQSAHRFAVARAVDSGIAVTDAILADYPGLKNIDSLTFK